MIFETFSIPYDFIPYIFIVICRILVPNIPRAGRGGAAHDPAGKNVDGSARPGDICPSFPPGIENNCPERLFGSTNSLTRTCRVQKPGNTTGEPRRGARGGGAESGKTVCQQNGSPREESFLARSRASNTCRLNVSPEARTSEILCKPMEEQNPRLNRGSSAVYHRDEKRSLFLAADQWNDAFLSL